MRHFTKTLDTTPIWILDTGYPTLVFLFFSFLFYHYKIHLRLTGTWTHHLSSEMSYSSYIRAHISPCFLLFHLHLLFTINCIQYTNIIWELQILTKSNNQSRQISTVNTQYFSLILSSLLKNKKRIQLLFNLPNPISQSSSK